MTTPKQKRVRKTPVQAGDASAPPARAAKPKRETESDSLPSPLDEIGATPPRDQEDSPKQAQPRPQSKPQPKPKAGRSPRKGEAERGEPKEAEQGESASGPKAVEAAQKNESGRPAEEDTGATPKDGEKSGRGRGRRGRGKRPATSDTRVQLDSEEVRELAREIFLADVQEEGTTLLNQKEAEELAKRSFEVAEIFLREQARRQ